MDISPVSAIRPITPVRPAPVAPDLSRVFEVEYLGQSSDDEYTPGRRKPARGLEDEEDENGVDPYDAMEDPTEVLQPVGYGTISFFA